MSYKSLFTIALVAGLVMVGADAFAAVEPAGTGGTKFRETLEGLVTGNIGLLVGLALAVFGIYTWVVKQETTAGLLLIVGGVLITIAPGVFNSLGGLVSPIVSATGGTNKTTVESPAGKN
jgi:hypothetical protein